MNILGAELVKIAKNYKKEKHLYEDYNDFFIQYVEYNMNIDIIDFTELSEIIFDNLDRIPNVNSNDEEVLDVLNEIKFKLIKRKYIDSKFNILKFVAIVLIGNLFNKKEGRDS